MVLIIDKPLQNKYSPISYTLDEPQLQTRHYLSNTY